MKERIRIKDIAAEAGVSPGTVDRVLHERGNVSQKSKEKVMKALESLNYSPNVLASVLAYNRSWKIAALMPSCSKDPFWSQPKDGIIGALRVVQDYGVTVDFYHFEDNNLEDFERKALTILAGDYQSVIVAPIFSEQSNNFMGECNDLGIPYVQINTCLDADAKQFLCYIGQDSYHSGNLGGKLLAFGLAPSEKVMICHMEEIVYDSQHLVDKERGFKDYFASHNSLNIDVVTGHFPNPLDEEGLLGFFDRFLTENKEVKGIFVTTSRTFHVVRTLRKLGKSHLKIVGFDLIDENLEYLMSEEIDFLINQNPYKQGYLALINIFNFLIRKIEPTKLQYLPLDVVMKENVSYYTDHQYDDIPVVL